MVKRLELAMLPAEADAMDADCYIVVDVLRATTTIAALFGAGLDNLLIVDDIDIARQRARTDGRLLFGEVNGLPPAGFDFGNSPAEAGDAPVAGREAVLFTTNGTKALRRLAGRGALFAGALVNLTALANAAIAFGRVAVVCAGSAGGTGFALDDFAAAAAIVARIAALAPEVSLGDGARLGCQLAERPGWPQDTVRSSHHAGLLRHLGLAADVDFACQVDILDVAPRVELLAGGDVGVRI